MATSKKSAKKTKTVKLWVNWRFKSNEKPFSEKMGEEEVIAKMAKIKNYLGSYLYKGNYPYSVESDWTVIPGKPYIYNLKASLTIIPKLKLFKNYFAPKPTGKKTKGIVRKPSVSPFPVSITFKDPTGNPPPPPQPPPPAL